ncbi:MAG: class II aldolase and adducin N-terminal domain-containing protein [Pseudomonadota bacterium]
MSVEPIHKDNLSNLPYYEERCDLAAAFRWAVRLNMHEAVANHFSLSINDDGTQFLINPNQRHFSLIRASDILLLDANDPSTMDRPDAPDETAWGLHGAIHRNCLHARCALHVHSVHATVLASLADSVLKPIDQNTAIFHNRHVVDSEYGGLAFEEEGERCSQLFSDPKMKVMVMGNHGIMVIGDTVADTFNRLYYFERAAETYIKALWTGQPLRELSEEIAEKTASEIEIYDDQSERHFADLKEILDREEPDFRN